MFKGKKKGMTLVECMISMSVLAFIMIATYSLFTTVDNVNYRLETKINEVDRCSNIVEEFKAIEDLDDIFKFVDKYKGSEKFNIKVMGYGYVYMVNISDYNGTDEILIQDSTRYLVVKSDANEATKLTGDFSVNIDLGYNTYILELKTNDINLSSAINIK